MSSINRHYRPICFIIAFSMLFSTYGCVGVDRETLEVLREAIAALNSMPTQWQQTLESVTTKLGTVATDTAKKVLHEVEIVYDRSLNQTAIVTMCTASYFSSRIAVRLQQIAHKFFPKDIPDPILNPSICSTSPVVITRGETNVIIYAGYDLQQFENSGTYRVDLIYKDDNSTAARDIIKTSPKSEFEIQVNLDKISLTGEDPNRQVALALIWGERAVDKSEVSIVDPPPPSTLPQVYDPIVQGVKGRWIPVGYQKSHQNQDPVPPESEQAWCKRGTFAVQLDLDGEVFDLDHFSNGMNYPIVGQVKCRELKTNAGMTPDWELVGWQYVGYNDSRNDNRPWCEPGSFIVGLDLDSPDGAMEERPYVGRALCARPIGEQFHTWTNRSVMAVGFQKSHDPSGEEWCPLGSFLIQLQLDIGGDNPTAQPFVGKAFCASPAP